MELDIKMDNEVSVVPPKGCQHYANLSEVPWDIHKYEGSIILQCDFSDIPDRYYHQRFSIFSKYDEGIWMTEEAWFGVTPEPVAR